MKEYQDTKVGLANESVVRYPSTGRRTVILKRVSWKSGMLYFLTLFALTGSKSLAFYGTYGTPASSTCWGREKASSLVVVPSRTRHEKEVSSRYNGIEEPISSPLHNRFSRIPIHTIRGGHVKTYLLPAAVASLVSGSVAGAIGVGIAFPLDTLKTKAQVMSVSSSTMTTAAAATASVTNNAGMAAPTSSLNMMQMIQLIYQSEGASGFFSGVRPMMIGQAFIKAVAFSSNTFALYLVQNYAPISDSMFVQQYLSSSTLQLIVAACFAGFTSSFLVNPVERIKVMMQASTSYKNELHCVKAVLEKEGWKGLLGRGLGPTLAREVPSYAIYFVVYGLLSNTHVAKDVLGPNLSPLIFGALSGIACWIPVYPIDVVKTLLQNSEGNDGANAWSIMKTLYKEGGIGAFFDGLTPKVLRAAVNHSATFYIYAVIMRALCPEVT